MRCDWCVFYIPTEVDYGTCQRYPPTEPPFFLDPHEPKYWPHNRHPTGHASGWCGEYVNKRNQTETFMRVRFPLP